MWVAEVWAWVRLTLLFPNETLIPLMWLSEVSSSSHTHTHTHTFLRVWLRPCWLVERPMSHCVKSLSHTHTHTLSPIILSSSLFVFPLGVTGNISWIPAMTTRWETTVINKSDLSSANTASSAQSLNLNWHEESKMNTYSLFLLYICVCVCAQVEREEVEALLPKGATELTKQQIRYLLQVRKTESVLLFVPVKSQ